MATAQERPATFPIASESGPPAGIPAEKHSRVILGLSGPMEARVEDLTRRTGYNQAELFNLAIALFKASLDAVDEGRRVGVVDDDREMATEFTGFHKNDPTVE